MITLYSYFRSTSAWRVRIALALKGVEHQLVFVHLVRGGGEQHQPSFQERNLMSQVPVLEVAQAEGNFRLSQSMAILEYLDERFPDPPILPPSPEARARAREFAARQRARLTARRGPKHPGRREQLGPAARRALHATPSRQSGRG